MVVKTQYKTYKDCYITTDRYVRNSALCVQIWTCEEGYPEPLAKLTTCINGITLAENNSYVDTNNCPWAMDFIREYKLGIDTNYTARSGFCEYPLVEFNIKELEKYSTV